jgi:hypothetical protein
MSLFDGPKARSRDKVSPPVPRRAHIPVVTKGLAVSHPSLGVRAAVVRGSDHCSRSAVNPSSAALLLLVGSVLILLMYIYLGKVGTHSMTNKGPGTHATCYDPYSSLDGRRPDIVPSSGLMSDLVYRFSSPVQMLRQTHSYPKVSVIYDLVDKQRCFWSLFEHSTSPPHSSHDETAPLLGPPSKLDGSICKSPATLPEDFRPIRLINQGVSGKVYLVEDKATKKNYALKVIRKRSNNLLQVINEKDALCRVTGDPWFLSLEASIHDDTNFYLITVRFQALIGETFLSDGLSFR